MLVKKLLSQLSQLSPKVAVASQLRFFSAAAPSPIRVIPSVIFAENHTDPVLGRVLTRLTPRLKAMTYDQFLDEKGQEVTLESRLQANEDEQLRYQNLASLFKKHHLDIRNPADVARLASHFRLNENVINHLRLYAQGRIAFSRFFKVLQAEQLQYQGIDLSNFTLEQAIFSPSLHVDRDTYMADNYLKHFNNCFGRVGLLHVDGIQDRIIQCRPLKYAKHEYLFFYLFSTAADKCCDYEKSVQKGAVQFPLGLHVINARNRKLDDVAAEVEARITQQIKLNAKHYQTPLPSSYLASSP